MTWQKEEEFQFNEFLGCWIMWLESQFILHMICNLSSFVHFYRHPLECRPLFKRFLIIFDCLWRLELQDKVDVSAARNWKYAVHYANLQHVSLIFIMLIEKNFHNSICFYSLHMIDDLTGKKFQIYINTFFWLRNN